MSAAAAGPALHRTQNSITQEKLQQEIASEKEKAAKRFEQFKSAWKIAYNAALYLSLFSVEGANDIQGLCKEASDAFLKSVKPLSDRGRYPAFDLPADQAAGVKNKVAQKIVEISALLRPGKDSQHRTAAYLPVSYNQWQGKATELLQILNDIRPVTGCCEGCVIL